MTRRPPATDLRPCFLQAQLVEDPLIQPVTITRIGVHRAQLSGSSPVPEGEYTVLEFDRPTDGERVKVGVRIVRVRTEGLQWGWRPAIHVEFLDPITDRIPVELEAVEEPGKLLEESLTSVEGGPLEIRSLSVSFDDTAEDLPAAGQDGRLGRAQAEGLALAARDLSGARVVPALYSSRGALPAMYGLPAGRREDAATPWGEPTADDSAFPDREPRVMASSPVAYLTSGRHRAGMVQDFSRGGLFMAVHRGEDLPPVGASIRVEFAVPRGTSVFLIGLMAEVRWLHEGDRPSNPGRGAGLAITGFDRARGREVYESYVESLVGSAEEGD